MVVLTAIVAVVVAITGLGAAAHGHLPKIDGWHGAPSRGASAHDDGLNSCSVCRLAHETPTAPVAPGVVPEPLRTILPRASDRQSITCAVLAHENSPRAPPCLASC